jgi:hypothetical protein
MTLLTAIITPLAGAILITIIGGTARAEIAVELHACSVKTCSLVSTDTQKGLGVGDTLYLLPSQVGNIASVYGCDECSKIIFIGGKSVFVLGTAGTIACIVHGGPGCEKKGVK